MRMARYEALTLPQAESILLLLRPSGTSVGAWAVGTGRKVPDKVARRARKVLRELMPDLFGGRRGSTRGARRRTSRAPKAPARRRRTSRRLG